MPKRKSYNLKNTSEIPKSRMDIRQNTVKSSTGLADKRVAVIDIEGPIGWDWEKYWNGEDQNTSEAIRAKIKEIDELDVDEIKTSLIECVGGVLEDGLGIYEALVRNKAEVTLEVIGYAASIATTIMMAGDTVKMSSNAIVLDHQAMSPLMGYYNRTELAEMDARLVLMDTRLSNIKEKHGVDMEALKPYKEANNGNGKWMDAETALSLGLVTEVFEPYSEKTEAKYDLNKFKVVAHAFNLPEIVKESIEDAPVSKVKTTKTQQEADMPLTPEETQKIVADTASAVIVALEASALAKKEADDKAKADVAVVVEFVGDPDSQEDLALHADKLTRAQLKNACDFNDVASVQTYQKALKALNSDGTGTTTQSNVSLTDTAVKHTPDGKDKDLADTASAMKAINKRDKERI